MRLRGTSRGRRSGGLGVVQRAASALSEVGVSDGPGGVASTKAMCSQGGKEATGERTRAVSMLREGAKWVPGSTRVRRRVRDGTPLWVSPVPVSRAGERQGARPDPDAALARYGASAVAREPDDFVLYRIIGNDLPPRHEVGQARRNLAFILEHEPDLPGCEKRFVVNRIVDEEEERQIVAMLEQARATYFRIPFIWEEYAQVPLDVAGVPDRYMPGSKRYEWLRHDQQERVQARLYRHKNNYVMNNNGARNAALDDGRLLAKWVMPWDGNCFLAKEAFEKIRETANGQSGAPYLLVGMARLDENLQALHGNLASRATEEPQVVFRRDATLAFDRAFPYGRRPKVELLWRLGVPGPWDEWGVEPWDLPCPGYHRDAGAFEWTSWVARLAAAPGGRGPASVDATERTQTRTRAILEFLKGLDRGAEISGLDGDGDERAS